MCLQGSQPDRETPDLVVSQSVESILQGMSSVLKPARPL